MTGFAPLSHSNPSHIQSFIGKARIIGPRWAHLPILTIGFLGINIFWSVEMGYASPYLLSLGLSKPSMAIVFLAGPLSGLIMQPLVGILADNTTSRFGRRRPWMMLGTAICCASMLLLGYTRGFAAIFTGWDTPSNDVLTVVLAVISIYLIDFAINAVMATDRALLVDTLPPVEQASGNAWAARMVGFGSVLGFFIGSIPLPKLLPFFGTTQLQILSLFVSLVLLSGHLVMAFCVKERILLKSNTPEYAVKRSNAFLQQALALWTNFCTLPPVIRQICMIQFFSSMAWFPLLFYTTLYIGDLYKRATPLPENPTVDLLHSRDAEATRLGTQALFYSAILALFVNLVLPICVLTPASRSQTRSRGVKTSRWKMGLPEHLKLNLSSVWAISHLVLALCMFGTFLTSTAAGATLLISVTGFSSAVGQWAPFSLLGEAILTSPDPNTQRTSIVLSDARAAEDVGGDQHTAFLPQREVEDPEHHLEDSDSEDGSDAGVDESQKSRHGKTNGAVLSNFAARTSVLHVGLDDRDAEWGENNSHGDGAHDISGLSAKAGIILGIHNVAIVVPQFIITGLSAVIFAVFDPVRPKPAVLTPHPPPKPVHPTATPERRLDMQDQSGNSNSVVYILRLGGIAAIVAFILTLRLSRELRHR